MDEAGGEKYEHPHAGALDGGVVTEDEGFDQDVQQRRDGCKGAGEENDGVDGALLAFEFGQERRQRDDVDEEVEETEVEERIGC